MGYDGANHLGDLVNSTQVLGLEHHLIETFGPRGQGRFAEAAPEPERAAAAPSQTVVAASGDDGGGSLVWDSTAERLMSRVPFFVRKKARTNIEKYARENHITTIDEGVVLRAREHIGG
jgi:light-independent protochlorophyllide reductase subunit B